MTEEQSAGPGSGPPPSEEEMRAALEAELRQLRVDDLLAQTVVSLLNLGARRAGLAGAGEDEVDLAQVEAAIEATQALLGVLEKGTALPDLRPLRDALAQLQLVYAKRRTQAPSQQEAAGGAAEQGSPGPEQGAADAGQAAAGEEKRQEGPGPAESSGRLWVPGR